MRFWRFDTQKFVAMYLDSHVLTCICWTGNYPDMQIVAQQTFNLDPKIVQNLVLCNPTVLKNYLLSFITKYNLKMARYGLILAGSTIIENLNELNNNLIEHKFSRISINGCVDNSTQNWSYLAHIPIGITLQYQLVFIQQNLNLIGITSFNGALLGLLKVSDFEITLDLKRLVLPKSSKVNLDVQLNLTDLNLVEHQALLACLGLYIAWKE